MSVKQLYDLSVIPMNSYRAIFLDGVEKANLLMEVLMNELCYWALGLVGYAN